jgi:hypothetical protein
MVALPIRIRAIFQDGKFVPQEPCPLPEAAEVQLVVEGSNITPPAVTDPADRQRILNDVVERMTANPIPANAPRFTRDELHERR